MTVSSWGTGRKDYSKNVEYSTNPIIRGPQTRYIQRYSGTLAAGGSTTINTSVTSGYVVMLYDFTFAADLNALLSLVVYAVSTAGSAVEVFQDKKYQSIYYNILKGFPFFGTIRSVLTNDGDQSINYEYTIAGFETSERQYNLTITLPTG